MAIRESLSQNRILGTVAGISMLVVGVGAIAFQLRPSGHSGKQTTTYFSDDNGQTFFEDSIYKFPPFDHNGKTADRAVVFENEHGRFVGYLFRFKPAAQKKLQDAYAKVTAGTQSVNTVDQLLVDNQVRFGGSEVKRPGDPTWTTASPRPPNVKPPQPGPFYVVQP